MHSNQRLDQLWFDALGTELGALASRIDTNTDNVNSCLVWLDDNSF